MHKLVLLRHGESTWNKKGLFTGWVDVDLTKKGEEEAREAGRELKKRGFIFDLAFTSLLKRAARTLSIALKAAGQSKTPRLIDWRLNERHYGNLQGLNKKAMAKKFGEKQVLIWRRSYNTRPPEIDSHNRYNQQHELKYQGIKVPKAESLKDVFGRVKPLWEKEIAPLVRQGDSIIIAASHNSLRALIKYLDKLKAAEVINLNIPTGIPLVYELDKNLRPIRHYYLADKETLRAGIDKIKNQGKIK